jgi:YD repeat-containing protein
MTIRCILPIALALATTAASAAPAFVARSATNDIPQQPLVRLAVTAATETICHAYEEFLPATVAATNITGGGAWVPELRAIHWGPFTNTPSVELTYRIIGPSGTYVPGGRLSADGAWAFTPVEIPVTIAAEGGLDMPARPGTVAAPVITLGGGTNVPVSNSSFEAPSLGTGNFVYYGGMTPAQQAQLGWVGGGRGEAALFANGSAWSYATVPDRTQGISLQRDSSISQTINLPAAGNYAFSWLATSRQGQLNPAVVQVDGVTVFNWQTTSTTWTPFSTAFNITTPGNHTITLAGLGSGDADVSVGVDRVSMSAPPTLPPDVTISCATPGVAIYYTLDGSLPTQSSILYTGALQVATATLIRARAFATNAYPSSVRSAWFGPATPPPTLATTRSVATNTPGLPQVSIVATQSTASVCWAYEETLPPGLTVSNITENGLFNPASQVIKWGPFVGRSGATLSYQVAGLAGNYSVRGRWSVDGYSTEEASSYAVVVAAAPGGDGGYPVRPAMLTPPIIAPLGSTSLPVAVTMSCATTGTVIRYTLDGTVPDATSTPYTGAVSVATAAWVRARSFASNAFPSEVTSRYFCQAALIPAPKLSSQVLTNTPSLPQVQIAVTQALSGVCWAYELWLPTGLTASNITESGVLKSSNSLVRWGPFVGRTNAVLACGLSGPAGSYALRSRWSVDGQGGEASLLAVSVTGGTNDIGIPQPPQHVARPALNPAESRQLPVTVSASTATPGAALRYTLDGTAPTPLSALYTNALNFSNNVVLRVRGFKTGLEPSSVVSGTYAYAPSNATLQVTRSISANGTPSPAVELLAVPPSGIKCYAVTETIPERLAPYSISHNGAYDETNGVVKWGPFFSTDVVRLSYLLGGMPGTCRLVGAGSADGVSSVTTGPDMIEMTAQDQLPDLAPIALTLGNEPVSERSIALTYAVTNSGKGFAAAHWTDRWYDTVYLSADANLDSGDTLLGRFIGSGGYTLAANAAYTNSGSVTLPVLSEGIYYLILKTDERGLVNELNEANNVVAIPIAIPASEGRPERVLEVPSAWSASAGDLDFSPDGVRLAVAAGSRVAVWNLQSSTSATNALLGSFTGHVATVSSVRFSPANDEVLSGSSDGTIRIWDARTFAQARRFSVTNGEPSPAAFSSDGARVLGGAARGVARIWDAIVPTNILRTLTGHSASITAVAFSPDGTRALTGSSDKSAILWNATTGAILYRWTNHTHIVSAVAFSPDGTRALTASSDGTIRIWNLATGASVVVLRQGRPLSKAVFSPDGLHVAASDRALPGMAYLWEVSSGRVLKTFRPSNVNPSTVEGVAFSPDRAAIATSHSDGSIRLWDSGLTPTPIHTAVPLPVGIDVPVTMQSHGLYYFEIDVPANRSLVLTVDTAAGGGSAKLSKLGAPLTSGLSSDVRFANHAQGEAAAKAEAAKDLSGFPPEADIEAFRVLATRDHLPSVYEYDHFAQASVASLHAEVPLSATAANKCYVLVFAPWLSAGTINAKIRASYSDFHLSRITPSTAGNAGDATLKVEGLGFTPDTIPVLIGNGHSVTGQVSMFVNSTLMHVTFNLRGATPETYDLRVEDRGAVPATIADALTVSAKVGPILSASISAPPAVRPGQQYTLSINYANTGDADMVAPIFVVSNSPPVAIAISPSGDYNNNGSVQVMGVNFDGPAGVLPPGARFSIPLYFKAPTTGDSVDFHLSVLDANTNLIDWAALELQMRPSGIDSNLWARAFANFRTQTGNTWADYLKSMANQATLRSQSGARQFDCADLFSSVFAQASGGSIRRTLAANLDAYTPAPGLPLAFARVAPESLTLRSKVGPLGRGWSHSLQYSVALSGTPQQGNDAFFSHAQEPNAYINVPGGLAREFEPDWYWTGGWVQEGPGAGIIWDGVRLGWNEKGRGFFDGAFLRFDYAANDYWQRQPIGYVLFESDGSIWSFNMDGLLTGIEEGWGRNRLTLTYSGGQLTRIQHSNGQSLSISYDGHGRIASVTDPAGQTTAYGYDPNGELLQSVTLPGGRTTTYAYIPATGSAADYALEAVTFPDGSLVSYAYDGLARLSEQSLNNGAERLR